MKNYLLSPSVLEYQIIDPETRDLRSHLSKIVDGAKVILNEQVKAEMHQSVGSWYQYLYECQRSRKGTKISELKSSN
jgi:hypothetical protein